MMVDARKVEFDISEVIEVIWMWQGRHCDCMS